jgi:hypothetical protein
VKYKTRLIRSFLGLIATLLIFATTIFAWITLSSTAEVNEIVATVGKYEANLLFEVNKNNGTYVEIETQSEMLAFFNQAAPGDFYGFRLTVENESVKNISMNIIMKGIRSVHGNDDVNMLDVFYLNNGEVNLRSFLPPNIEDVTETILVDLISNEPLIKYGQILNNYRFSNIAINNDLMLTDNYVLGENKTLILNFVIVYDSSTENILYQEKTFAFDSIIVNFK